MFALMSPSRATRCCCVHRRVKDEGFRPERRMAQDYGKAILLSIRKSGSSHYIRGGTKLAGFGLRLRRHQDPQLALVDLKFYRALPDQFAIDFHRNIFFARYPELFGLKIFDLGQTNLRAEQNVLQIFDDLEITELFEDDNIEQAIINHRVLKEWERTSIKT